MGAHPYFTAKEFALRLLRLKARMRAAGVAVALFDEIEAMTWISGFGSSANRWRCVAIPLEGEPFFLIRALDASVCRERSWIADVPTYRDWEDPMPVLAAALAARGLDGARIGLDFDSYGMSVARFAAMRAALPRAEFVDIGAVVAELRLIKSPAEIALLRRAAGIADQALQDAAALCIPGASQRDAAKRAQMTFVEMGGDPYRPGPITAGRGWDFLHGHLGDAPLARGDVVHIELTPRIHGYSARVMRCVVLGEPEPERSRAATLLAELQDRQIAALKPGAIAADVDAILRRGVIEAGLRDSYDNITGYTLGLYGDAGPRTSDFTRILHPEANWAIEAGMVFHIYASAGGAALSETVLVTENGPELLTRLPRGLFVNP
ncbi:aminopeptidase P family protein [Roseomonas hellenica]|uniref:Aminopeptidase P family protein n=1 Tax=Plastoroseomonas hellenica TaxID=2687306 RepID=A0ABS5F8T2_9PROT|nr:Xaa-Pro peptidase family protein [Plastoroseomonas hellenica]MBR0668968.1 aminopeptidase P family protein [Plastoroseomonas hellenica]